MTPIIQPVIALQHIAELAAAIESSLRGGQIPEETVDALDAEVDRLRISRVMVNPGTRDSVIWHGIIAVNALNIAIIELSDMAGAGDDLDGGHPAHAIHVMSRIALDITSLLQHLLAPQCGYRLVQPVTYWIETPKEPAP
jgi:hypothetical protein